MLTAKHRDELEEKGYTVIENAVQNHAQLKKEFFDWMKQSFPDGSAPYSVHSLVRNYGVGYLEPTWRTRLEVKKYFEQLWGTEQLLCSTDAVAIGEPPEKGVEVFDSEDLHWLHVDQSAGRVGLHAYQGAVYLETADVDDWTFEVLEGSHEYLCDFYAQNKKAAVRSCNTGIWRMRAEDLRWYAERGCTRKRVAVKAGGLLLWDSRLVHANARPIKGRAHPDRWRLVVLVCMGPVAWTTPEDLKTKRKAYNEGHMTSHWPCDDIGLMASRLPSFAAVSQAPNPNQLPDIARSLEVRQLVGVTPYKVTPESKVPAWRPKWDAQWRPDMAKRTQKMYTGRDNSRLNLIVVLVCVTFFVLLFGKFLF